MWTLINKLPKCELHLHIEGSLEPELLFELANKNNIKLNYDSIEELKEAYNFNNLQEFLDLYYLGTNVLITESDFYDLTYNYFIKAHENNIVHAEIFFDPQAHTERGIKFETCFNGIKRACDDAKKNLGISSFIIMSFLRHLSEEDAFKTLEQSRPFLDDIIGIGLDSSEKNNPPEKFKNVYAECKKLGLKLMAHAGEEGPVEYIKTSLELLKVDRIDHGNAAINDDILIKYLSKNNIPLTLCPLSNLELKVVSKLNEHPLKNMLHRNLLVTVNSDDPAYFGGYLNENLIKIAEALNLDDNHIKKIVSNSFTASFLPENKKNEFIEIINTIS